MKYTYIVALILALIATLAYATPDPNALAVEEYADAEEDYAYDYEDEDYGISDYESEFETEAKKVGKLDGAAVCKYAAKFLGNSYVYVYYYYYHFLSHVTSCHVLYP